MTNRIHPAASRVNMLAKEQPATYIAFDLLADGDESLLETPLKDRRKRLEKLLGPKPEAILLSPITRDREVALGWLKEYRGTGLDGIVAKRIESIYPPGGPSRWSQDRDLAWEPLRPELVCEVAFDRLENDRFRHGVGFVRWRPDKSPQSCTLAQLKAEASVELKKLFA